MYIEKYLGGSVVTTVVSFLNFVIIWNGTRHEIHRIVEKFLSAVPACNTKSVAKNFISTQVIIHTRFL